MQAEALVRVLPNKTKSNRSSQRIHKGPHARTYLLWQLLLASLVLDPLIPALTTPQLPLELAISLATLCAVGTLPFLAQGVVHRGLSKLRHLHSRSLEVGSKTIPLSLAVGAGTVILVKLIMFAHLPPAVLLALMLLVLAGGRKYISQMSKQSTEDKVLFASNPWAKVQRWEHQVIVFATLPLLFARGISLCGALAALPADEETTRLIFISVSALFLGMLRPDRDFFVGICKRCKHPVPIVFQDLGSCLNCDVNLRVAYHLWANRLSLFNGQQELEHGQKTSASNPSQDNKK